MDEGVQHLRVALEIARDQGDETRLLRALSNLGAGLTTAGEYAQANGFYAAARTLYQTERVEPGMDVVWLLSNIAYQNLLLAEFDTVILTCDEALEVARETRCFGQMNLLWALKAMAFLERHLERNAAADLEAAITMWNHADPLVRRSGEKFSAIMLLTVEGRLALERNEANSALSCLTTALQLATESGNQIAVAWVLPFCAEALLGIGADQAACELIGFLAAQSVQGAWIASRVEGLERDFAANLALQSDCSSALAYGATLELSAVTSRVLAHSRVALSSCRDLIVATVLPL